MKKVCKLSTFTLMMLLVVVSTGVFAAEQPFKVFVTGQEVAFINAKQTPYIDQGQAMLPMRAISDKLGISINWNSDTQTVTAARKDTTISFAAGSDTVTRGKNWTEKAITVKPQLKNGIMFVPAQFFSDNFGAGLKWVPEQRAVKLCGKCMDQDQDK